VSTEKAFLIEHLQATAALFESSIRDLDYAAWTRAGEGQWSAGQCAEHALAIEKLVAQFLPAMAQLPEEPFDAEKNARKDEMILGVAERGATKIQAPPQLHPGNEPRPVAEVLAEFEQAHGTLLRIAAEFPQWLRGRFREHPILKKLDGYQWILVTSCHTRRHLKQMEELQQQYVGDRG